MAMGAALQHRMNVLYVYCRLREFRVPKQALKALKLYEALVHRCIYRRQHS